MIDNNILELYTERRELMSLLLSSIQNVELDYDDIPSTISDLDDSDIDRATIIEKMSIISEKLKVWCDGDYLLLDMYRRLSLALSKEKYEEATDIRNEIMIHK